MARNFDQIMMAIRWNTRSIESSGSIQAEARSPELEILITGSLLVRVPAPTPVLDGDAEDVEEALEHVARDPDTERHGGALARRRGEYGRGDGDEGEVPEHVEHDDGLGVGPVGLALLEVLGGRLPHRHGGLPHQAPAPSAADEPRRAAEAREPPQRAASGGAGCRGGRRGDERRGRGRWVPAGGAARRGWRHGGSQLAKP